MYSRDSGLHSQEVHPLLTPTFTLFINVNSLSTQQNVTHLFAVEKKTKTNNVHKYVFTACVCSREPCCPSTIASYASGDTNALVLQYEQFSETFFVVVAFVSVYLTFHFPLSRRLTAADWLRFCCHTDVNSITAAASAFIGNIDIKRERFLSRQSRNLRQQQSEAESDWTQLFNNC